MEKIGEKPPYGLAELHLFVQRNEKKLREEPCCLISGVNWFIAHPDAPIDGFSHTGVEMEIVVDDLDGRKTKIIFLYIEEEDS